MTELIKYASIEALDSEARVLLEAAIKSRERAYAPYSHFRVGAAVLLENGKTVSGNNQENAAYPSGLCAERVAVFSANANFPDLKIRSIAISCRHEYKLTDQPFTSCGACRQVLLEFEQKQDSPIKTFFYGETGEVWELPNTKLLLPFFFDKSILE